MEEIIYEIVRKELDIKDKVYCDFDKERNYCSQRGYHVTDKEKEK